MKHVRRALARLLGRRPAAVTGPHRIYVRRTPAGAVLDVEHYLVAVLTSLADDPELLDLLMEIAEDRGAGRQYDGHEPERLLVERLASQLGYELPLYGDAVASLADRLHAVAPVIRIPQQRAEGGAAA
ncbi:hypothetical protein ACFW1M_11595 [Streptomyces inhibens]|uniref:hypothetical protein n=1 Tax=Streptomyces inhibens TaxID=2293571 RepID=UPI0036BE2DED